MPDHSDPATLERLYNEEELSMRAIASKCGVSTSTIRHYMEKFEIERRGPNEHSKGGRQLPESAEPLKNPKWLRDAYHKRVMTQKEIADELGTSQGTVQRYMVKHDISSRGQGGPTPSGNMRECEVANYLVEELREYGYSVKREVKLGDWISDVYIQDVEVAFEVKGWSGYRPDFLKAVGQASAYRACGAKGSYVVIPDDAVRRHHAPVIKSLPIGFISYKEAGGFEVLVTDNRIELIF